MTGEKFYATGALFAHFIHIGAVGPNGKVHLAIAPRGAPGLTIVDNWSSFGQRTTASGNVFIDHVRVDPIGVIPAYLGGENPSSNGAVSQLIQAAVDAGIAKAAIEDTIGFVRRYTRPWIDSKQEQGFGGRLHDRPDRRSRDQAARGRSAAGAGGRARRRNHRQPDRQKASPTPRSPSRRPRC